MSQTLVGASVFEQELYDHLTSHVADEVETLRAYQALAESTESQAFRFLAELILKDERRPNQMLEDLAETVKVSAELSMEPAPDRKSAVEGQGVSVSGDLGVRRDI